MGELNRVGLGVDLKVYLRMYYSSPTQISECEERNLDTCSRGNVLWFDISSC